MKSKKIVLIMVLLSLVWVCCEREFHNPYDRECPPEIWTPQKLIASLADNTVRLTWEQPTDQFDGFFIDRSADSLNWYVITPEMLPKDLNTYIDNTVNLGDTLFYRIYGIADLNISDYCYSNRIGLPPPMYDLILTPSPPAGGSVSGQGSYRAAHVVDISATPNTGWRFTGWSSVSENVSQLLVNPSSPNTSITMPARNVELTANFERIQYQLALQADPTQGATQLTGSGSYNHQTNVSVGAIEATGYTFVYWTDESRQVVSRDKNFTYTMPARDVILTARFQGNTPSTFVCGDSVTFFYRNAPVTYGSIRRNGVCWLDRNLGAARVATSPTDDLGYGHLFQWGRGDDGHQLRSSGTHRGLSPLPVAGHADFISPESSPYDWISPQNNTLWQGANSPNNPCPAGWRLPTAQELESERLSWTSNDSNGAFNSSLKWSMGGYRHYGGDVYLSGSQGTVWSSTIIVSGNNYSYARSLVFYTNSYPVANDTYYRASGRSVRCVINVP